jgi:hypothetical protein
MENVFALGSWVDRQRQGGKKLLLRKERRQELDKVGFVWNPFEADWEEGFRCLTMYKEREGHCRVPQAHNEKGFGLGSWVRKQRGDKDNLSVLRRQRLDQLGFIWVPFTADWEEGFRCLTMYKEREGHCRVPRSHEENGFRLGGWVGRQRQHRIKTLSEACRQRLNELGFVWDPFEAAWEDGLEHLRAFVNEHKHCQVPQQYKSPDGYNLGNWVRNTREPGSVSAERKARLDALGFHWKVR